MKRFHGRSRRTSRGSRFAFVGLARFGTAVAVTLLLLLQWQDPVHLAEATLDGASSPGPPNFTFDSPSYDTGTPPTNFDFNCNCLTGWTVSSGTVATELRVSPSDYHAKVTSLAGVTMTSSSFLVPSDAQTIRWQHKYFGGGVNGYNLYVVESGQPDAALYTGATAPTEWKTVTRNISNWRNKTIQLKFTSWAKNTAIDNVAILRTEAPLWDFGGPTSANLVLRTDGPNGNYVTLNNAAKVTSSAYPFNRTVYYYRKFLGQPTSNNCVDVWLLNAGDNSTIGPMKSADCGPMGDWTKMTGRLTDAYLPNWTGGLVKLQFVAANSAAVDWTGVGGVTSVLGANHPSADAGGPFDTTIGNENHNHTDLFIPGKGVPLEFSRHYHSQVGRSEALGNGWSHTYDMGLVFFADGSVMVRYPDGHTAYFTKSGSTFTAPAGTYDNLVQNGDTTYTLTTKGQIKYNFDTAGNLTNIKDRNNNTTTLNYTNGRLTSVTDPGGRSLTFEYEQTFDVINTPEPALAFTNSDFEAATYQNWTTTGTAFGSAPTSAVDPGKQGSRYASSYRPNNSNTPTGTLTSQSFTAGRQLTFRINGGTDTVEQRVALLSGGNEVLTIANDTASFELRRMTWDTTAYEGQSVQVKATDSGTGSNDHVGLDYVQVLNTATGTHTPTRGIPILPFTNADFEEGTWANWDLTGTAFYRRPIVDSVTNTYYATSYVNGDSATGAATSISFTAGSSLSMLLAGSNQPGSVYAALVLSSGSEVLLTTPAGYADDFQQVRWDTSQYAGQTVKVRLVDNSTTGHIIADDPRVLYSNRIKRVVDPLNRSVTFSYDAAGNLSSVLDVKNGTTSYAYSSGRMTTLTDSNLHVSMQNTYDRAGRVVEQRDALNNLTCSYYGTSPTYTSASCPGVTPGPALNETVVVNPRGFKTTYVHDSSFRTIDIKDAQTPTSVLHFDYDPNHNVTCVTDQRGKKTAYSYDSKGNVTQMIDAANTDASCALKVGGVKWTFTYNAKNDISSETDPLLRYTDYIYDDEAVPPGNGNLTRVVRKESELGAIRQLTCFERDSAGLIRAAVQSTDLQPGASTAACTGNKTLFDYDTYGNQICAVNPRFTGTTTCASDPGKKATFIYDLGGRILYPTDENTNNSKPVRGSAPETGSQCGTDGNGNGVNDDPADDTVIDDGCPSTKYTYDPQNNVLTVTDGLGNVTTSGYDAKGNLTSVKDANRKTAGATPESGVSQCGTDGTGDGENDDPADDTVVDDGCLSVVYSYDNGDRLDKVIQAAVSTASIPTTTYGYDENGNRKSVTSPKRQAAGANPESGTAQCGAALTGNGVNDDPADDSVVDDGCPSTKYAYDNIDRLQSVTGAIDYLGRVAVTSYEYDAASNLTQRTDARGLITRYFPDDLNRLDLLQHCTAGAPPGQCSGPYLVDSVDYTYNAVGFRSQMIDPTGTTTYTPDTLDRVSSVTTPGPKTVSYTYDDAPGGSAADYPGQRTKITYPDGKYVDYTYLADGRMSTVTDWLAKQTTYTYDDGGRLSKTQLPDGVYTHQKYDAADRLTCVLNDKTASAPASCTSGTAISKAEYTLDAAGNRTSMAGLAVGQSYYYDALYRITNPNYPGQSDAYIYDANGNRTLYNEVQYSYDAADQLTCAHFWWEQCPSGGTVYGYDANGNQTSRGSDTFTYDHENRLTQSVIGGVTSSSVYNGDGLRMSHTVSGQTTGYTWDVGADLPVALQDGTNTYVYGLDLISATDGGGAQTYFLYDGLGSTTDLVDGSGIVIATYSYDVFGAIRSQTGSSPNYWLFTGEQRDADGGLYYLRARYYDPALGRFLGRDTFLGLPSQPSTLNAYVYALNNPTTFIDPEGLFGFKDLKKIGNKVAKTVTTTAHATAEAFGPPYSTTKLLQIADIIPLAPICGFAGRYAGGAVGMYLAGPIGGGAGAMLGGYLAYEGCSWVETRIGDAAALATFLQIQRSNCPNTTKGAAHALNAVNWRVDYKNLPGISSLGGRAKHFTGMFAEIGMYVASSQLLDCAPTIGKE